MKKLLGGLAFLLLAVTLGTLINGCSKAPTPRVDGTGPKNTEVRDPFKFFAETIRYNPGSGDDWTRFRDPLKLLDSHFTKADVINRMKISAAERKFLEAEAHLSPDEFKEIEATAFRNADSHYFDECTLLRDVYRAVEVGNAGTIEQSHFLFRYVMRNVMLHEQVDEWIPPAFTLRRGCGSALDRALVYLALLRQARTEGCLIVVPDTSHLLVGVREGKSDVRLFDPRLGLAIVGKDGKSAATLAEVLANPALLEPSGITAENVKKLEVRLVCPLFALSPRMLELQKGVAPYEPLTLHLNAPALAEDMAKVTQLPVKVWNAPLQGKMLVNSPTRELWMFLPKQEGGIDNGQRFADYQRSRIPLVNVLANLARFNVSSETMPQRGWLLFSKTIEDLFNKYDLQPREMLLRGQRDAMMRRTDRMELFVDNAALAGLQGKAVHDEILDWLQKARDAHAGLDAADPKVRAESERNLAMFWGEDTFVGRLIQVDKDEQANRNQQGQTQIKRTVLTKILAIGARDYFVFELARDRAAANHEVAERRQIVADGPKSNDQIRDRAHTAWVEADSAWDEFYIKRISLQGKIDQGMQQLVQFGLGNVSSIEVRIGLLESLHLDVHKYFQAKIRLGECELHTANAMTAKENLGATRREIEAMEAKAQLKSEVEELRTALRNLQEPLRTRYRSRLDLLASDWSERGNYYWLKQQIDRRIAGQR